jgi:AcrR family transcriptional regulator
MNDTPYTTEPISGADEPPRLQTLPLSPDGETERMRGHTARPGRRADHDEQIEPRHLQREHALERRRRILEAATVLWAEHGMISDTIRSLATKAEVAPATIYNLVGNRDETLTEIMTAHAGRLTDRVRAAAEAASGATPAELLEAMLAAFLQGVADEPHAHFLLQHGLGGVGRRARDMVKRRYRTVLEVLGEPLMQLAPSVEGKLAAALAMAAVGAAGDALLWFDPKQEQEVAVTARRLTAMLLAAVGSVEGLGPRPGCGGPVAACAQAWAAGCGE